MCGRRYSTTAVCRATGFSVRQLDYLDRMGYHSPSIQPAQGSGSARAYSEEDIRVLTLAKKFSDFGFTHRAIWSHGPDALERKVEATRVVV